VAIQANFKAKEQAHKPTAFKKPAAKSAHGIQRVWVGAVFGETVDIGGAGYSRTFGWPAVSGTTAVEIQAASIRAGAASVETLEPFTVTSTSQKIDVKVGSGKAVRTLKLDGFEGVNPLDAAAGFKALHNSNDVSSLNLKVLISVIDPNGAFTPFFAIPAVSARGVFPQSYTGASFSNDTVTFNAPLPAETIRIQLVQQSFPDETAAQQVNVSTVSGTYLTLPTDMKISLDDGSTVFELPGDLPLQAPDVTVSLIQPLISQFQQKLDAQAEIAATLTIQAKASDAGQDVMAQVAVTDPQGYLVRTVTGVHTTILGGDDQALAIAMDAPLAEEAPDEVTADVMLGYDGIKILPDLSAAVPPQNGNVSGQVVTTIRKLKSLPPAALIDRRIARIGIIGRAPEECELVLELIDMTGGVPGAPLLDPVVLNVPPEQRLGVHWFSFAQRDPFPMPLGLGLRANAGRFFWVSESAPLVRMAVYDEDPGSEAVYLGGQTIVTGDQLPFSASSFALPAMLFAGEMPVLRSNLFLTVDVADLTLRYAR
jgi:hypothetical protein